MLANNLKTLCRYRCMTGKMWIFVFGYMLVLAFLRPQPVHAQLSADGMVPSDSDPSISAEIKDPFEGLNRAVFGFNNMLCDYILNPISDVYDFLIPKVAQKHINNVYSNLRLPKYFANELLQGKFRYSQVTLARFMVNSTFGIGGLFDPAGNMFEADQRPEDFGQTLGFYGVGEGNYLVLPFLGPRTGRDFFGGIVDLATDPIFWLYTLQVRPVEAVYAAGAIGGVNDYAYNIHDRYEDFRAHSIEPYVAMRDAYVKYRRNEVTK